MREINRKGEDDISMKRVKYLYQEPHGRVKMYDEYIFGRSLASINEISDDVAKRFTDYSMVTKEGIHTYADSNEKFVIVKCSEKLTGSINEVLSEMILSL